MPQTYKIKGMHCASCASIIQKTLKKIPGVHSIDVNYGSETAKIDYDETATDPVKLSEKIKPLGYSFVMPAPTHQHHESKNMPTAAEMGMSESEHAAHLGLGQSQQEKLAELAALKRKLMAALPLTVLSIIVMAWETMIGFKMLPEMPEVWKEFIHHLLPIFATYMLFVVGLPYLQGVYRFLRYGKANMDSLIGIGTFVAFIYSFIISSFEEPLRPFIDVESSYYDVTIVVIAFITLGKYLEARSKIKTGAAIQKLLTLQAKTALVIRDGTEQEISIDQVTHGETIIVKPGGKIPVDGTIISGSPFIDESMITGEPIPAEKNPGDTVIAGTLNTTGVFQFKATKVGSETLLAHIIKMVEEAQGSKAPIQGLADSISAVFVPIVLVLSAVTLAVWLLVGTSTLGFSQALSLGIVGFVSILVIACPCALGLATPTAIIVGVGKGAEEGILIKDAATLEKLHSVTTVVMDKTGTLTRGKPELISLHPQPKTSADELVSLLAALEAGSEHPIAHAIVTYAQNKTLQPPRVEKFEIIKGQGVKGMIHGEEFFAGNAKLITGLGLAPDNHALEQHTKEGKTPIILATRKKILGIAMVADALKPESRDSIDRLHRMGIKIVMLTGDDTQTAKFIAQQAGGIDEVVAEVLPQDKLEKIKSLQQQGAIVAMVGDGVNDAPALAQADVGIAMATGNDAAIETAGITLLHGDISKVVKSIRLSKLTMRGIKQNLFWAFIYNIIGIPLAAGLLYPAFGWLLNPIFAGMAMAMSSVSVVGNSLRLKTKKL